MKTTRRGPSGSSSGTSASEVGGTPGKSTLVQRAPAKTDEEYETTMGVKDAIDKGKMVPVAGINGQSFVATGVAGKKDGKITFKFVKAYVGDYDYAAAGGKTVRGAHVVITATLENCGAHSDVKLVQVFRNIVKNGDKMETAEPDTAKRKQRAGLERCGREVARVGRRRARRRDEPVLRHVGSVRAARQRREGGQAP